MHHMAPKMVLLKDLFLKKFNFWQSEKSQHNPLLTSPRGAWMQMTGACITVFAF